MVGVAVEDTGVFLGILVRLDQHEGQRCAQRQYGLGTLNGAHAAPRFHFRAFRLGGEADDFTGAMYAERSGPDPGLVALPPYPHVVLCIVEQAIGNRAAEGQQGHGRSVPRRRQANHATGHALARIAGRLRLEIIRVGMDHHATSGNAVGVVAQRELRQLGGEIGGA